MRAHLQLLAQFSDWATRKTVESLHSCPQVPERGVEILSHLLQAQWYFLDLLKGNDGAAWYDAPNYTLAECEEQIPKVNAAWREYLATLADDALQVSFNYTGYDGKRVSRVRADMIFHTFDHCTYHRGQIAMLVRQAGGEPAKTWFNRWVSATERGTQT